MGVDIRCEDWEDGVVVLEKCSGRVGELERVDVFGCEGVGVCDAGFFGRVRDVGFFFWIGVVRAGRLV